MGCAVLPSAGGGANRAADGGQGMTYFLGLTDAVSATRIGLGINEANSTGKTEMHVDYFSERLRDYPEPLSVVTSAYDEPTEFAKGWDPMADAKTEAVAHAALAALRVVLENSDPAIFANFRTSMTEDRPADIKYEFDPRRGHFIATHGGVTVVQIELLPLIRAPQPSTPT